MEACFYGLQIFDKRSSVSGVNMHSNNERPWDLAKKLHKPIIRKFKKEQFIQDFKIIFGVLI